MADVRMMIETLTQSHVHCVEGIRRYIAKHDLPWNLQLVDRAHAMDETEDCWWILLRNKDLELTKSKHPGTMLFGKADGCFILDEVATGKLAARHFEEQGYTTIGVIDSRDRRILTIELKPCNRACQDNGLHFTRHEHLKLQDVPLLIDWLRDGPHPLAMYTYTDPASCLAA